MLRTNRQGQGHTSRNRVARRSALVALLAAMTCQGVVAAEGLENPFFHSHPPLPVESDRDAAVDRTAPRQNPYFKLPPAEGLVTLTGGELPEPTLLRPTSSRLVLQPVQRDEQQPVEETRASTIQLGQPKTNAFAHQAAPASSLKEQDQTAAQASFDRNEAVSEVDGAVTFSFSDAADDAADTLHSEPSEASDENSGDGATVGDDSHRKTPSHQTERETDSNAATAAEPGQVEEATPVQLAPLTVDDATNSAVDVPDQRGAAAKHDAAHGAPSGTVTNAVAPDDEMPTLLRPVEPIIVMDDSGPVPRRENAEDDASTQRADERKQTSGKTSNHDDIDQHTVNGAPIVIDRGAVAKIRKVASDSTANSSTVTQGTSIVIDVPRDFASATSAVLSQQEAFDFPAPQNDAKLASNPPRANATQPESASQPGADSYAFEPPMIDPSAEGDVSAELDGAPEPENTQESDRSDDQQKTMERDENLKPTEARQPVTTPPAEIEHLSEETGEALQDTSSATDDLLMAGEVSVATAAVESIPLEKTVHCFAVENSTICQVMATNSDELRIIGQQKGKTRIAVWHGPRQSTQPVIYTVRVTATADQDRQSLLVAANKLNLSLLQTFPGVDVRVTAGEGQLTVHGSAEGDEQARRILRLIRQACLVPVIDDIVVR